MAPRAGNSYLPIDFFPKTGYDTGMESFFAAATQAIGEYSERILGVRVHARLSRRAMLAAPDFVRENAKEAASALHARRGECALLSAPLLKSVREENGWLLFTLDSAAFDAYAAAIPDGFSHGDAYLDRRMEMLLRHGDAPLPDCDAILCAVLAASYASARGKWTAEDERAVLTMTHGLSGMARVRAEHRAAHAAKLILYERRFLS